MINKICAGVLLVLSLLPFTAPFSTCDLGALLGHADTDHGRPARAPIHAASAPADGSVSLLPPFRSARTARLKVLTVADGCLSSVTPRLPPHDRGFCGHSTLLLAPAFALPTILRL
jgi:hypothetical protein